MIKAQSRKILAGSASGWRVWLWLVLCIGLAGTAHAATFTVTKTADTADNVCDADCSLREAIYAANNDAGASHTISIPVAGTYTITLAGTGEEVNATGDFDFTAATKTITVSGAGQATTIIDANSLDRVFDAKAGITLILQDLTVKRGLIAANGGCVLMNNKVFTATNVTFDTCKGTNGGAVYATTGFSVTASTFTANWATATGGAIYNTGAAGDFYGANTFSGNHANGSGGNGGGAIFSNARVITIHDAGSTFTGNYAGGSGGAIYVSAAININAATTFDSNYTTVGTGGAIISVGGSITETTFKANHGINYGGAIYYVTTAGSVSNSTFESNYVNGGAQNYGGAFYSNVGSSTFSNVTFSGNTAANGGAIYNAGVCTINNSTFYDNDASSGTGDHIGCVGGTLKNSIVYSTTPPSTSLCYGVPNGTNNIQYGHDTSVCGASSTKSDPSLAALASNGGNTKTHALNTGSPAIDGSGAGATASDQRGVAAVGTRDSGAYEYTATTTLATGTDPGNTSLAPGGAATNAGAFSFQTSSGTDVITAATVTLAAGTSGGLSLVEVTSADGATVYGSAANPGSDAPAITLSTNPLTATTSLTEYRIRITPKSHANMPAPTGSSYAVTAYVSDWTGTNTHAGSDTAGTTVTIDNTSTANVTDATATAGNTEVVLGWTNPADGDLHSMVVLRRATSAVADVPVEGTTYVVGNTIGTATVACVVASPTATCTDTGLSNGTAYHYLIFAKDSNGNYSATGVVPTGSPATPVATITISGTVYTDEGVTTIADGATVRLVINGVSAGTDTTVSGAYSISTTPSAGDAMIVYIDGHASDGTTVTVSDGNALAGLNIYADHLIVRHDNGGSLTNANMTTALGAYSDTDILYTTDGSNNLTVSGSATELFVWAGDTYAPGATITTTHMDINGTLDAAANAINVAGNWDATGGVFTSTGTVTFNAASGTNTIIPGGVDADHDFQNIVFNDAAGTATFQLGGAIDADGDFTVTDGIFDTTAASSYAVTVAGTLSDSANGRFKANASTITVGGDVSLNANNDATESADFNGASLVLNGAASQITYTSLNAGWNNGFNNLTVGAAGVTDTLNSSLAILNDLTIGTGGLTGAGTLFMRGNADVLFFDAASTLSITGVVLMANAVNLPTLTNGYGTNIILGGVGPQTATQTGAVTLNAGKHLQINGYGVTTRVNTLNTGGFALTVGGDLIIGAGGDTGAKGLTANGSTITVTGNFTVNTGTNTFSAGTSTVILNGTNQTITGSTTFNSLTKQVATARILTFAAGSTTTVNGTATLNGASGQLLSLVSSSPGTYWNFTLGAASTKAISYVSVTDSDASGSDASKKPVAPTSSTDGGHNVSWFSAPSLMFLKTVAVTSDPINGGTNPKYIPGAEALFTMRVTNSGAGTVDNNTLIITDPVPTNVELFTGNLSGGAPFIFADGTPVSGLSCTFTVLGNFADCMDFSNDSGASWTYVPNGSFDPDVTNIRFGLSGAMNGTGGGSPYFDLQFRVRVK